MNNMMRRYDFFIGLIFTIALTGCLTSGKSGKQESAFVSTIDQQFLDATAQYKLMKSRLSTDRFPKTFYSSTNEFKSAAAGDWCSGFYPGTLFLLYQQTKDTALLEEGKRKLAVLEAQKNNRTTHDLGFMMYCSFGTADSVAHEEQYQQVLLTSARSLATRFNPRVGCIKSWDGVKSWDGKTVWTYPVIIDNMINLELLFYASKVTGDPSFREMAISHARKTMMNHVRPDYSSYHVVNYDPETGLVKSKETHQGFSDNSTWSRGEAWGIYGFTMVYRETREKSFLQTAEGMANYFLNHLPADMIPAWDFQVDQPGFSPRWKYDKKKFAEPSKDASAAAIAASALIELSGYTNKKNAKRYLSAAESILLSLSTEKYKAAIGENGNFILKHSTGNAPAYSEIDVPLTYADYYFIEALTRYKALKK